ncbi:hypothetical protein B0O99DRAFT_623309 [Bisporella sp. PMI_857]|nr:hypothetical protein B0O99DRAFT_623309 [Bisporella sp. PMI_857]
MQRQPSHEESEDIGDFIVVDTGISEAPRSRKKRAPRSRKESFAPHTVDTRFPQPSITPIPSHGSPVDRWPAIHGTLTPASVVANVQRVPQTTSQKVRGVQMIPQSNNPELEEIATITNLCHPTQQVHLRASNCNTEMATRNGKAILIYGDATVLQTLQHVPSWGKNPQSRSLQVPIVQNPSLRLPSFHHFVLGIPPTPLVPIITVRLQEACGGRFSVPYSALCFGSNIKVGQFFAWFARLTGRGAPQGPSSLLVWLHDARYSPKVVRIMRCAENGFQQAKHSILEQYAEAKLLDPGMTEFAIFITEMGWRPYPPEYFRFN